VTNTGNTTLGSVSVADTQSAPAGPLTSGPTCPQSTLAPAASQTCTGTYKVTQADLDNGSVNDSAVGQGTVPGSTTPTVSAPSTTTVPAVASPALLVVKSAVPTTVAKAGQVIDLSFVVTNTGNVTVGNVAVNDTQNPPAGALTTGPTCPQSSLAPAASETCTATYKVTQADVDNGKVDDSAVATGTTPDGGDTTSPPSTATVSIPPSPSLTVLKSASPATVSEVGQAVTYSFLVTNTGNVTEKDITLTDTQSAPAGALTSGPACPQSSLAPGASETCTGTYLVTAADVKNGKIHDTAVATGTTPGGTKVSTPPATATVAVQPPPPTSKPGAPQAPTSPIIHTTTPVTG
jgi:uncharacterized repeat protein (TIGR01451 family)